MKIKFPDREGKTIFLTLNENNTEDEKSQNDINSNQKNDEKQYVECKNCSDKNSIVLIGANGSGKTRLSVWIDKNNEKLAISRISAQKSLDVPSFTQAIDVGDAKEQLQLGNKLDQWTKQALQKKTSGLNTKSYTMTNKWNNAPETHELKDIDALMQYLVSEDQLLSSSFYHNSINYTNDHCNEEPLLEQSILFNVKVLWEKVISHKVLIIESGKILVQSRNCSNSKELYNGHEMSDGERAVFYFIGQVLSASKDSLIIIDEPENHLHNSIISRLWNLLEEARPDCVFLYITHNLDFALRSKRSVLIWVKDMPSKDKWNYEFINEDDDDKFDSLQLQMLGCREKIVLVEGNENSYDCKIYSALFPNCKIIPVESCAKVKELVRTFNSKSSKFFRKDAVQVYGIVDRDRMDDSEVAKLNNDKILVLNVAEIENVFLLTDVISLVATQQEKKHDEIQNIITKCQSKIFKLLKAEKTNQCNLYLKNELLNKIEIEVLNKKITEQNKSSDFYKGLLENLIKSDLFDKGYDSIEDKFEEIINKRDYDQVLKKYNNKGLLAQSDVCSDLGVTVEGYKELFIRKIEKNSELIQNIVSNLFYNQPIVSELQKYS